MKICNLGSLNMDFVYRVDRFVLPGETKSAKKVSRFAGGKGLNQSVALAKAEGEIYHGGPLGEDGEFLKKTLEEYGVKTEYLIPVEKNSGHAIIQVEDSGQNCILLYGGSNQAVTEDLVDHILEDFDGRVLLLQNEINAMPYIMRKAHGLGYKIFFNAAPMNASVLDYPLDLVNWLIVNEVEGMAIAECDSEEEIIPRLKEKYPDMSILLTLGSRGSLCVHEGQDVFVEACNCPVVDTTGAGDTFIGFFMATFLRTCSIEEALMTATVASALAIGKEGASDSVPSLEQVEDCLKEERFGKINVEVRG